VTDYLIDEARRNFVPIPDRDEPGMWEECHQLSLRQVLTNKGVSILRQSLREERKSRHEWWILALSTLVGIIGALTGLIAVMKD